MRDSEPGAMDVESRTFKSYGQGPNWWTYITSGLAIFSIIMAIIAIALAGAALNKANDDDEEPTLTNEVSRISIETSSVPNEVSNHDGSSRTDPPPGSSNYSGYHHHPRPPRGRYFDVVVHGTPYPDYWNRVQKGIDDAAQQFRVDVNFEIHDEADAGAHAEVVQDILQSSRKLRNGLAIALLENDPQFENALRDIVHDVPILSMLLDAYIYNDSDSTSDFARIGLGDIEAALFAAEAFAEAGVNNTLCLKDHDNFFGQEEICEAFNNALGLSEGNARVRVSQDVSLTENHVNELVQTDGVRGILTLGLESFDRVYTYLKGENLLCSDNPNDDTSGCVLLATFDENEQVLEGIISGEVQFAVDRQLYLQGYLAIMMLYVRSTFQAEIGVGIPVLTGPRMIDSSELAERLLSRDIMNNKTIGNLRAGNLTVRFIVHGKLSDPFWRAVRNGARLARRYFGMEVEFYHPGEDITTMTEIAEWMVNEIDRAFAEPEVNALVLTIPINNTQLFDAISNLANSPDAKPVFTINSGHLFFADLFVQSHVGVLEEATSERVIRRLNDLDVRNVLCVIPEAGNEDLMERCETLGELVDDIELNVTILDSLDGGEDFHIDMLDRDETIRDAVFEELSRRENIDCVVSAAPAATIGVRAGIADFGEFCEGDRRRSNNSVPCFHFVAYDLIPQVFTYIRNDEMAFAVDSQPAVQGLLSVTFAMFELLWGSHPLGLVQTAPKFVDSSNVENAELFYAFEYT
eukprot:g4392.t1